MEHFPADGSCVPSARVQTYDVVFRPYNAADLAKISGWDGSQRQFTAV
mgnify:CR=1 FL=1